jgi:hypothetical protein
MTPVADGEFHEGLRDFESVTEQDVEDGVGDARGVEVAHDEEVVVFGEFVFETAIDPLGKELELVHAGLDAVAPADRSAGNRTRHLRRILLPT